MARKAADQANESTEPKLKMNQVMALKGKARETSGSLWLKLGAAKIELPGTIHVLADGSDVFVSIKGGSSIFKINEETKKASVHPTMDEAYKKLLKSGKVEKVGKKEPEVPQAVLDALAAAEKAAQAAGFKVGYDLKTGMAKIIKPRAKKEKGNEFGNGKKGGDGSGAGEVGNGRKGKGHEFGNG